MMNILFFLITTCLVSLSSAVGPEVYAREFFTKNTKPMTKVAICRAFGERSVEEYSSIRDNAQRFLGMLKKGTDKIPIISAVASAPLGVRGNALDLLEICHEGKSSTHSFLLQDFTTLVKDLSAHDPIVVSDLVPFLQSPAGAKVSSDKMHFIQNIIQSPAVVRQNVLTLAGLFLEKQPEEKKDSTLSWAFYAPGLYGHSWMRLLAQYGQEIDEESLKYAFEFSNYLSGQVEIWGQFRRIMPRDRLGIVTTLKELLPYLNFPSATGGLIDTLSVLGEEQRDSFPTFVGNFLQKDKCDSDLLKSLSKIAVDDKAELIGAWRSLRDLVPPDKSYGLNSMAVDFVDLPPQQRRLAYPLLESLLCRDQSAGCLLNDLKREPRDRDGKDVREDLLMILRPMVETPGFDPILRKESYQSYPFWDKEKKYLDTWERGGFSVVIRMVRNISAPDRMSVVCTFSQIVGKAPGGIGPNEESETVMRHAFKVLGEIPIQERDIVVSKALELCPFLTEKDLLTGHKRFDPLFQLISMLASFPTLERQDALSTFRQLNAQWNIRKPNDIGILLEFLKPLSLQSRRRLVSLANTFFPLPLQGYFCQKPEIFKLARSLEGMNMDELIALVRKQLPTPLTSKVLNDAVRVMNVDLGSLESRYFDEQSLSGVLLAEINRCKKQVDHLIKILLVDDKAKAEVSGIKPGE